jgi:hypothetical protein
MLRARTGGKDLPIYSSISYGEARARAEFLARFLKLPLRDASTEHPEVLQPDARQELLRKALPIPGPVLQAFPPQAMRSHVEERAEAAQITIPGPGFRPSMFLGLAVPFGFVAYVAPGLLSFFQRTHTPEPVQHVFLGFLVFVFGVLPLLSFAHVALKALRSHTRIIASRERLTIENRGAFCTRRTQTDLPSLPDEQSPRDWRRKSLYPRPLRELVRRRLLAFSRDNNGGFNFGSTANTSDWAAG